MNTGRLSRPGGGGGDEAFRRSGGQIRRTVFFLTAMLMLAGGGWMALQSVRNWETSQRWVAHTHEMLAALDGMGNALAEAEASQRGFLLTGEESYLAPYGTACADAERTLLDLDRLTAADARLAGLVARMRLLVRERIQLMEARIADRRAGRSTASELSLLEQGRQLSGQIRRLREELEAEEKALLVKRQEKVRAGLRLTATIVGVTTVGSVGVFAFIFAMMGRENGARRRAEAEARAMRDRAEAASRVKSQFLANMSHEIRTPLNGILGMAELLRGTGLTEQQKSFLRMMQASSESLMRLINDILDLSRIEAGRLKLEEVAFSLREVIELAVAAVAERVQAKGLELVCDLPVALPDRFQGDPTRLTQVLVNLLGNAVKFTERGEILLRIGEEGVMDGRRRLLMTVSDTGAGIPKERREAIFEPFQQADLSTTRRFGGSGLGLAIARELVTRMGGRMWVESEEGKGSAFHFTVTLRTEGASAAVPGDSVGLTGMRVLVVEDSGTQRRLLEEVLTSWRMEPVGAADGAEAMAALRSEQAVGAKPFGLALVDGGLGTEDGFRLVTRLREEGGFRGKVVMLLSALPNEQDLERSREVGDGRVSKPVTPSRLLDVLMGLLAGAVVAEARKGEREAGVVSGGRPLRLLLVDDNEVNQVVARGLLERAGHAVVVASSGAEAVERFEVGAFDAVFMDIQMPGMDGFEAARRIRAKEEGAARCTWVVAMTAHAMKGDREHCLAEGMDDYLSKPVQSGELVRVLGEIQARSTRPARKGAGAGGVGVGVGGLGERVGDTELAKQAMAALAAGLGDDERTARVAAEAMVRDLPKRWGDLQVGVEAGRPGEVMRAAHTLKSHFRLLGEDELAESMKRMEEAATNGDLSGAATAVANHRERVGALVASLRTGLLG